MVFLTTILNATLRARNIPGPDRFWKRQKILRMSAHFYGRKRNCFTIARRYVHKALLYSTQGRQRKMQDMTELWITRIQASCAEHGIDYATFRRTLKSYDIFLSNKVLADIAVYEPRTFKSLASFAWHQAKEGGLNVLSNFSDPPPGVFTRGMKIRESDNI